MKINETNAQPTTFSMKDDTVTESVSVPKEERSGRARADQHMREVVVPQVESGWKVKRGPAITRRLMKLKLSDQELTEMLKTHEGRSKFGYNYLERITTFRDVRQDQEINK